MGSPIGNPVNAGDGHQQLKAMILRWVRAEVANVTRGGSPVTAQAVYFSAANFALAVGSGIQASQTITVPAGFSSAVVAATARVIAYNPNTTGGTNGAGGDYLRAQPQVAGNLGVALPLATGGSGASGINTAPFSSILTGLVGGGTFVLAVAAWTDNLTWAANAANLAELSGVITWYR